jgi:hypothetical protein
MTDHQNMEVAISKKQKEHGGCSLSKKNTQNMEAKALEIRYYL